MRRRYTAKIPQGKRLSYKKKTKWKGWLYVYGTRGEDGVTYPDKLPAFPVKGDKVVLLCQLSVYNDAGQVKLARLISFEHVEVDPSDLTDYEEMTIAAARDAEAGKKVIVSGVVAQITYANGGYHPNCDHQ